MLTQAKRILMLNINLWAKRRYTPAEISAFYDRITPVAVCTIGDIFQTNRPSDDDAFIEYVSRSADLKEGQKILDAGCGVCGPAIRLARILPITIEALTISRVQTEIARSRVHDQGLDEWITVTTGDFHQLDTIYPRDTFDKVLFLESFGYASNPQAVIQGVHRTLKAGGYLYIKDHFLRESDDSAVRRRYRELVGRSSDGYAYNYPDLHKTLSGLRRIGFHIVHIKRPEFENDETINHAGERLLGIDLFEGKEPVMFVEPLEILCQKLAY